MNRQDDVMCLILCCAIVLLFFAISVVAFTVGVNIGRIDAYKEKGKKRIEVILHKQDSIIQKLEKEAQNDFK